MPGSGKKPNTVSISRESVSIVNRRPFSPALIAAHSGQALRRHQHLKSLSLDERHDDSYQRDNHGRCDVLQKHRTPPSHYFLKIAFTPRYMKYPKTIAPTVVQNSRIYSSFPHRLPLRMREYYRIFLSAICDFGYPQISKVYYSLTTKRYAACLELEYFA